MTSPISTSHCSRWRVPLKRVLRCCALLIPASCPIIPTKRRPVRTIDNWRTGFANWHRKRAGPTLARSCSGCREFTPAARSTWTGAPTSWAPRVSEPPCALLALAGGWCVDYRRAELIGGLLVPRPIT